MALCLSFFPLLDNKCAVLLIRAQSLELLTGAHSAGAYVYNRRIILSRLIPATIKPGESIIVVRYLTPQRAGARPTEAPVAQPKTEKCL